MVLAALALRGGGPRFDSGRRAHLDEGVRRLEQRIPRRQLIAPLPPPRAARAASTPAAPAATPSGRPRPSLAASTSV